MRTLLVEDYKTVIEDYNHSDDATALGQCVYLLLEQAANKHEDNIAIICAGTELMYGELNALANRFARFLMKQGIGRGDLVGVALDRSIDLIMILLAVLKTGAAYVPIDPAFPAERIKHTLNDASPKFVVVSSSTLESLASWRGICLNIDVDWRQMSLDRDGSNLNLKIQPDDLAYVIYTSGSTGRPKGVEITHEALSNMLLSMQQVTGCDETDRLLAIATISFDLAVPDMFLPLLCGGTIVIAQQHETKSANILHTLMRRHAITMMQGTPSTWQMLLDYGWPDDGYRLAKILCGGEALSRQLADRLLAICDGGSVWNMYGPTEATVWASSCKLRHGEGVFIGRPLANYKLYVLDEELAPVSLGSTGELYIGGSGLARGYHNNADLTRSRFLKNPFHGKLMYRTGDLARVLAPGKLSLLGRVDSQVKVRGHRIELSDIESAIMECEGVSKSVVVSHDERLVAYCKPSVLRENEFAKSALSDMLRQWLAERLPSYMMPAFFVEMDTFPMTPNGKVDRKVLPDPTAGIQHQIMAKPDTELERHILDIWSRVLGHGHIGINDNFFQIGGDSLRIVRVQAELEKLLGQSVWTAKLFQHYTVKTLAAYLANMDKARRKLEPIHSRPRVPSNEENIAIVSMACRFPGGVTTPEEYWDLLVNGGDAVTDIPKGRWNADDLYSADPSSPGKSYCRQGGFLPSIDSFDASFFGISPREARALDPTQYMMLETCWEGFERAGYTIERLRGSQTGVYIGTSNIAAYQEHACDYADLDGYACTGTSGSTISGRVSYVLGLEGPTLTVDTACSSSLVAMHLACNALRQGECDMAVSGGITLMLTPGLHIEFSRLRGMSPDGRCRAFSDDTQGTGWAEGVAAVVLKRLSDAQRDGDTVHAVLRGSAVNHGGRSAGLTTPSGPAQERLIRSALAAAGLQPGDIDYVEAHGTATRLGDPIEGGALAGVFRDSRPGATEPLWVGSAKSNIGHTQAAAGMAGLLKVVLALRHNTLPRTLHIANPTPSIDWQGANMALVQQNRAWLPQGDELRRAGVSSFGIGGTNAHAIVEEAPKHTVAEIETITHPTCVPHLLPHVLSGHTDAALRQQAKKLLLNLEKKTEVDRFRDVAYSLATTRNHLRQRLVLIAQNETELLEKLATVPDNAITTPDGHSKEPRLTMLFTGQGSQWPGMGRDIARQYPVFRETLAEIAAQFQSALAKPLLDVMWAEDGSEASTLLQRTDYAQPALFGLEVALWRLWDSWGVRPEYVLGHSVGEIAAAHIAGIMDLPDACRLVAARGRLMHMLPGRGKMASLEASGADVEETIQALRLGDKVDIASLNTPAQTVISGDVDSVEALSAHFSILGRKTKALAVSHAFHSHHMDGMLADFLAVAKTVAFSPPTLTIVSGLTGKLAEVGQLEKAAYWVEQARNPVCFNEGIQTLIDQGVDVFLELGPRPVLCGIGAMCIADGNKTASTIWLPSLAPSRDGIKLVQGSLAELHVRHFPINWAGYFEPFGCRRVDLPTYAFQQERFWTRRGGSGSGSANRTAPARIDGVADRVKPKLERCKFGINWHRIPADNVSFNGSWGLLSPTCNSAWAEEVKLALSTAGIQLYNVSNLKDAKDLDGLLCLWYSDADVLSQTREFTSKALAQLQDAAQAAFAPPLVWVTRNAVGTGADDQVYGPGASILWGLMRTARNEHPELRLRLLDLGGGRANIKTLPSCLMLEIENECAIRKGQVLVPRMEYIESPLGKDQYTNRNLLRRDGAVLITGGTGGIGQSVARWLVNAHGIRHLVLTSRRGIDAPGAKELVDELAQSGAKATVVAGDIADIDSINNVMMMFGKECPLRGVVHTAGVTDDGILSALTPLRCDATFKSKVDGAWYLHQLTRKMDLDLFVMFSSISGIMGTAGQGNYAAANTFLDTLAYMRHAEHLPATSVAWGLWGGKGMGANMSETGRLRYAHLGLHQLAPEDGLELFEQAVHDGSALTVAAAYDLDRLRNYYDDRNERPPLLLSLLSPETGSGEEQSIRRRNGGDCALRESLRKATPGEYAAIVLAMVRETVATTLGFASPHDVNVHLPLQKIGIDSLTAVLTRGQLANLTGLTLSPRIVFDYPNLTLLSQFLLSRIQESWEDSSSEWMSGSSTSLSSVEPEDHVLNMAAIRQGCLDPKITFANSTQCTSIARPKSILVTGGTGFVGAFIIHKLLELGIETYCLVRAASAEQATRRLVTTLSDYGLWKSNYTPLLKLVVGDMAQPLLGLAQEAFNQLAGQIDAICHSGALVDWMRPLEDYVNPNIVSTHEILRLASQGRAKTIHLISTASTLPKYVGNEILEDEREYGYATSKWIAEQMVAAARWRGANASVYRLPFVTASTSTGHFRHDRGDFLHNLVAGSIDMGWFPSLDADLSAVLPVDYLASTIAAVMTQDLLWIGHDFDFLNARAPGLNQFFKLIGAASRGQGQLPFAEWRLRALNYAAAHPSSSLARIATIIDMLTEDEAAAMIKASPVGRYVFGGEDYPVPLLGQQFAQKYVDRIDTARTGA